MTATETENAITNPLDQLRGLIRRYVLIDGLLTAALFAIVWFWLGLAADYGLFKATHFDWVLDAPKLLRIIALALLTLVLVGILVTRLWLRLHRELSYPALALVLEKRFPAVLGDKLITAVELADVGKAKSQGYSEEMLRHTIAEARERVATLPVRSVFNWRRLRIKAVLLGLFALGTLAALFGVYSAVKGTIDPGRFASSFSDISAIWAERNLFVLNTPWPRQAHIELLNFPGNEVRVGKDAATPPKVETRAYKWVIADRGAPHGWRPLCYSDLVRTIYGGIMRESIYISEEMQTWDMDRIEPVADSMQKTWFEMLENYVADPANSRSVRKLDIPEAVTLNYAGTKTSGKVSLARQENNVFTGEVAGLKESVRFTVKGSDFSTLPRSITLVPPPMFTRLTRTEYQPAYLYHAPPVDGDHASLKGMRQTIAEKDLSLTGDKSVFSIVQGTEFDLAGTTDKKLSKVILKPKVGKLPTTEIIPTGERDSFRVAFRGADKPMANLEFDIVLVDDDNVTTTRNVLVQVSEDQPPTVDLAVDILRKQGNAYLVTPIAVVPFLAESKVRDDLALGKVEFTYTLSKVESAVMLAVQSQALASVFASMPLSPSIVDAYVPAVAATFASATTKSAETTNGAFTVPQYGERFKGLRRHTAASLKDMLSKPLDADAAQILREVKFQNQATDVFDLREAIPQLARANEGADFAQRFRIELLLAATDANVETGPKVGTSLEPIRLLVISQEDLLGEISRDEQTQAGRMDEVLKKLREAQSKLITTTDRLTSLTVAPDVIVASAVRAQDIAQDVAKGRELTAGVKTEYQRLLAEATYNRLRPEIIAKFGTEIIGRLDRILEKSFGDAEKAHTEVQTALNEGRRPDDPPMAADRQALADLIKAVEELRALLYEQASINGLKQELIQLRDRQIAIGRVLKAIYVRLLEEQNQPQLLPVVVEVAKGETKAVKQGVNWRAYVGGALRVNLSGPASLTFPKSVTVNEDRDDFDWTVSGSVAGEFTVTLTPNVGPPVNVTVRVK